MPSDHDDLPVIDRAHLIQMTGDDAVLASEIIEISSIRPRSGRACLILADQRLVGPMPHIHSRGLRFLSGRCGLRPNAKSLKRWAGQASQASLKPPLLFQTLRMSSARRWRPQQSWLMN